MIQTRHAAALIMLAGAMLPAAPALAFAGTQESAARAAVPTSRVMRYQRDRGENRFEQTERQTRTVKIGAGGSLELHNMAGDITVAAGGGDTATIDILKTARGTSDADARAQLALVPVDVIERAGRVEVWARYPDDRRRTTRRNINVSTAYRVTAPAGTRIKTDSISGRVTVSGIRGELALGTISGDIRIQDAGRVINGQTISGNVELVSAQDDAVVELSSTSGNVHARGIKVRRIDLGSISGSIIARDLQCDQADLHTMSGNVEYTGSLTPAGRYDFRSHSGNVRLTVGTGVGFEIEASSFSGEVRSGLQQLRVDSRTGRRNRTIRGTYGDGRARIEATSFSGDVVINGR
ncbi:MAG: DUF4097 family beta strand repeat-containing protein [Vicinamibacterales bacterium]